ncbi:MAG: hypothetical protein IKT70_03165 [Clostridia bacterium]|nr:hypothetical protein [Clostridia bacterium]
MKLKQATSTEEKLYSLLYPTVYIELVRFVYEELFSVKDSISSESLRHLYELAKDDIESNEYRQLERYYGKNADKLRSVNSVTLGINLNVLYQPTEAGIISLNKEKFKSGDLLDRIIKLDFEKDEFHCIAPITVIDKKLGFEVSQQVNYAFLNAMEKVLSCGFHHCSNRMLYYIKESLAKYFEYIDSLKFILEAVKRIKVFKDKNIPLCFPSISRDRTFNVVSLYDDSLCRIKEKSEIVPNTVCLENGVCCYILTGPNSGGKTVFINSLTAAQYYFQLGMPIPAKEASLPICDAIFKISVEEQAKVDPVGRFEKECISLSEVLKKFTPNSLALIDEAFTSTSATEALPIAANFISELCNIGGKCIFITHYHELCEKQPKIAKHGERVDYLHTEAHGDHRSYAIQNGKAKSNSYAQSIAKKYGLIEE